MLTGQPSDNSITVTEMNIESDTLFVVGESDELVCVSSNQAIIISGLKRAEVDNWKVSMADCFSTVLYLEVGDDGNFSMTRSAADNGHDWLKFKENAFLNMMALTHVDVNYRRYGWVNIRLEFSCVPVTLEDAVYNSLAQEKDVRTLIVEFPKVKITKHEE